MQGALFFSGITYAEITLPAIWENKHEKGIYSGIGRGVKLLQQCLKLTVLII